MIANGKTQGHLAFGRKVAATSIAAFNSVRPVTAKRKKLILARLEEAGAEGRTRYEIAEELKILVQSICGLVRQMVETGHVVELGDTRPAPSGSAAKIVRLPKYAGGGQSE